MDQQLPVYTDSQLDQLRFFCPKCRDPLTSDQLEDIYMYGLTCPQKHRFFIEKVWVDGRFSITASEIELPENPDDLSVISHWLRHEGLRSRLNSQLAYIIRRVHEIETKDLRFDRLGDPYQYCTLCRFPVERFEQDNDWVEGVQCAHGHRFLKRAGIRFELDGRRMFMGDDLSDRDLCQMIGWWLEADTAPMRKQMHEQIRRAMERFRAKFCQGG